MPAAEQPAPKRWLIAYNSISASLWLVVLFNTVFLALSLGQPFVFEKTNVFLTVVQTLAVVEIINAATGVVKSPLVTTVTQVLSRLLIVWGVMQFLPDSPANRHWAYITLNLLWSITEVIRYSYYAANLQGPDAVPYYLTWLRYSTFWVLYPTGVASEISMIVLSLGEAERVYGTWLKWALVVVVATYAPGFYALYTYMIKQRKKVLGKAVKKTETEKKDQ